MALNLVEHRSLSIPNPPPQPPGAVQAQSTFCMGVELHVGPRRFSAPSRRCQASEAEIQRRVAQAEVGPRSTPLGPSQALALKRQLEDDRIGTLSIWGLK